MRMLFVLALTLVSCAPYPSVGVWIETTQPNAPDAGLGDGDGSTGTLLPKGSSDASTAQLDAYAADAADTFTADASATDASGSVCNETDRFLTDAPSVSSQQSALALCWWDGNKTECLTLQGISWECAEVLSAFINCAQGMCWKPCAAGELVECRACRMQCQTGLWPFDFPLQ